MLFRSLQGQLQQLATLEAQIEELTAAKEETVKKVAIVQGQTAEIETQQVQIEEQQPASQTKAKTKKTESLELEQKLITSVEPSDIQSAPDWEKASEPITKAESEAREITEISLEESVETIIPLPESVTSSAPTVSKEQQTVSDTEKKQSLVGKNLAVVGNLTKLNREQAKDLIQKAGGQVISSPNAKTDYVIVGKAPGDKLKKAQKLGIAQLSEAQFLKLLESLGISV